jgi:arylsulfatase A-like enzyme
MFRSFPCLVSISIFISLIPSESFESAGAADPPNLVLMMGDDHGWEETGFHGHPHVKTPILDEMAANGLRLDRFYAAHPNCSPTRASFLTGRHPNRMGTFEPGWSFRPEEITMAHVLARAGYRCGHFGKWHVGAVKKESPVSPGSMGFHEWLSHDNFFELNPTLSRNGEAPVRMQGESSEILVRAAIEFIEASNQRGSPFLVVLWFGSPHEPYSGLEQDLALYSDLPKRYTKKVKLTSNETGQQTERPQGEVLRERYAEITAMDRAIGQMRTYLAERKLKDNTIVFYCGDNGTPPEGAIGGPHRGRKSQIYEGGVLVPGVMEWPARISQPRTTEYRACTSDLLPTLCSLAGAPLPERKLDGIDFSAVLATPQLVRPQPLHFWMYNTSNMAPSRLVPWIAPELQEGTTPLAKRMGGKSTRSFTNFRHPELSDADSHGPRSIIEGNWKLIVNPASKDENQIELYDLANDPSESNDLQNREPLIVQQLRFKLSQWQSSVLRSLSGADYERN